MTARMLNDVLTRAKKLDCKPMAKLYTTGGFTFTCEIVELNVTNNYVKVAESGDTPSTLIALDQVVAVKMRF